MTRKTFVDCNKRWPDRKKSGINYEIWMTVESDDVFGEFGMEWFSLGLDWSPRLGCFHDGFKALEVSGLIPDLYSLGDRVGFSPETFKAFLLEHGFVDETDK